MREFSRKDRKSPPEYGAWSFPCCYRWGVLICIAAPAIGGPHMGFAPVVLEARDEDWMRIGRLAGRDPVVRVVGVVIRALGGLASPPDFIGKCRPAGGLLRSRLSPVFAPGDQQNKPRKACWRFASPSWPPLAHLPVAICTFLLRAGLRICLWHRAICRCPIRTLGFMTEEGRYLGVLLSTPRRGWPAR